MIKKLRLENFKGIKSGEIELAPLTILLGANNSGKTTILEALFLAPNPFRQVPYIAEGKTKVAAEIVHLMHETLDSEGYAFLFNRYASKEARVECEVDGEGYFLQFIRDDPYIRVSASKTIEQKEKIGSTIGELYTSSKSLSLPSTTKVLISNTFLLSSSLIRFGYNYLNNNWALIVNLGVCKRVAEEVSALSNEKYTDLTIEPFLGGRLSINAYTRDGYRIRLGDLGEGVQNYIVARVLYEIAEPEVFLWDDVEAHFNPKMLLSVAEWFSNVVDKGKQVILTTHSLEAARMIAGIGGEKAKIYLTSLNNGVFKAKELTLKEVEDLLKAGIDVRVAEPLLL